MDYDEVLSARDPRWKTDARSLMGMKKRFVVVGLDYAYENRNQEAEALAMEFEYFKSDKGRASLARAIKKQQAAGYYRFGKGAISILRQGALKRGLPFTLTADSLEAWWQETPDRCAYCAATTRSPLNWLSCP